MPLLCNRIWSLIFISLYCIILKYSAAISIKRTRSFQIFTPWFMISNNVCFIWVFFVYCCLFCFILIFSSSYIYSNFYFYSHSYFTHILIKTQILICTQVLILINSWYITCIPMPLKRRHQQSASHVSFKAP